MKEFNYSKDEINNYITKNNIKKVAMLGVYKDLEKLKPIIEKLYTDNIFYLSYWLNDAPYHCWDKSSVECVNMKNITDGITDKVKEIYALILGGLGIKIEDEEV
jgi:hypothetical protein